MPKPDYSLLIIEDDRVLATTIQDVLELAGYASDIIHDGATALKHLTDHVPDLILLDMHLPKVQAWIFCTSFGATRNLKTRRLLS